MKILQVVPALSAGGVERTTIEIAGALHQAGHTPYVASAGGRLESELTDAGGVLHRLPLGAKNPIKMRRNTSALIKIIKAENIDIVHARSRAPAWSAHAAARHCGVAYVTTYHGIYNAKSRLKRRYNSIMAKGDLVIANSQFTADHITAEHLLSPDKIRVIPRGVDMARFDPAKTDAAAAEALRESWGVGVAQTCLLLPGRLTNWKGQLVAITALADLPADYALVLLGDAQGRDDYITEMELLAKRLGVRERVHIPGHSADMPTAFAACDITLAPSTDPEAFGRVAAEAQAMGKWTIASNHGGATETIDAGVTGARIPPGDAPALAKAILAGAPQSYDPAAARAHIQARFSDRQMMDKTLAVYAEIMASYRAK